MTKALDGEELYNQITHKYTEATELINHLLDRGEDKEESNDILKCTTKDNVTIQVYLPNPKIVELFLKNKDTDKGK